jgi:hypothetical protein
MKKYIHKSGHYIAEQDMYGAYKLTILKGHGTDMNRSIGNLLPFIGKDLIEDSKDWIEMIEIPVGEYYSKVDISNAIRKARECITDRMGEYKTTFQILNEFTEKIWQYLSK